MVWSAIRTFFAPASWQSSMTAFRTSGLVVAAISGRLAQAAVAYTQDFAEHSHFLSRFLAKVRVIPPPVVMPLPDPTAVEAFRTEHDLADRPVVGMPATRLAAEKGVEVLVEAAPRLLEEFPRLKVLFAGQYEGVVGEEDCYRRVMPKIEQTPPLRVLLASKIYETRDLSPDPQAKAAKVLGAICLKEYVRAQPDLRDRVNIQVRSFLLDAPLHRLLEEISSGGRRIHHGTRARGDL